MQVMVPTGFKPGACGELDSKGEHWVDRDLRLRHVGRSPESRIFHGGLTRLKLPFYKNLLLGKIQNVKRLPGASLLALVS